MSWAHFSWMWTIEPIVLIILLGVLVKIVVFNYRQVELLTEEMYTSVVRAQTYLQQVDHEFEVMNTCAKSVKNIFVNFGRVYREIAEGGKTVEEALKTAKTTIPEELRSNLSDSLSFPLEESVSSLETDDREKSGSKESFSIDLDFSKLSPDLKPDSIDTEGSGCRICLNTTKDPIQEVFSNSAMTKSEIKADSTGE